MSRRDLTATPCPPDVNTAFEDQDERRREALYSGSGSFSYSLRQYSREASTIRLLTPCGAAAAVCGACVRVMAAASNHARRNLMEHCNAFGDVVTHERAIVGASPEHIDLGAFRAYLQRLGFDIANDPQPDSEDDLRNRDVIVEFGGELRATLYGVLAFGKDPQRYRRTRNFRIECVAYAGDDRACEVLQVANATGRIDEQVERAVGWFMGLGRFESYRNLVREDRHLLPRRAIREALANAVTHRDYAITGSQVLLEVFERRVDVTSPGALPNHMTVERVRAGANPRSRNESMAHFMAAMGFMEQRGRGWLIMRSEMRAFNATEPELVQDERNQFVQVSFCLDSHESARPTW